jgi:4-amino-4-deoxy-L-arabinose transferase-like glycosyltransferase
MVIVLGCALRLGYGVGRYRGVLTQSGSEFIMRWDYDALEHVMIAQSILEGRGYLVDRNIDGKTLRWGPSDALFKAPLYQYFLAAVFAVSGYTFWLLLPLQALIGGLGAAFAALAALDLFRRWEAAAFAGVATAAHPLLVNSASQPYNENLFIALMFASMWAFTRWLRNGLDRWAVAAGALIGLAMLCRESAAPLAVVMAVYALACKQHPTPRAMRAAAAVTIVPLLVILPWSIRTYVRTGAVIPVSTITSSALVLGNNDCVAAEPMFSWYLADRACASVNAKRADRLQPFAGTRKSDPIVRNDVNKAMAAEFIATHPLAYGKLSLQRAWTLWLPFHPNIALGVVQKIVLTVYWLVVVVPGLLALCFQLRRGGPFLFLALLSASILIPQMLVYISSDMRLRLPVDVMLAFCAGYAYAEMPRRMAQPRF